MQRREFERVTPELVGIRSDDIEKLLDELESGFTEMHGIQIMRRGKICAEGWWQPYAPGLVHGLQSLTKTYAATAIGIAYTEGLLTLHDKIIDIFPEELPDSPSEYLKLLTIRDVLCMGCGMETMPKPTANWIRDFLATPVVHKPGTTYMYNSTGSTLLGAIVKKLTGEGLHDYLKPRLFDKIGIDAENLRWIHMPDGVEVGGGGLFAATEDNLRLMKLYADGGLWDGVRVLAADYVEKATSLQNESYTEAQNNPDATDNFIGYGFQIWMCKPKGVYRADGAMGQFAIVCPEKDIIISINETANGARGAQKTLDVIWSFLDRIGTCEPLPEIEDKTQHLSHKLLRLSLPAPTFAPYSNRIAEVDRVAYKITKGGFTFENTIVRWMSGGQSDEAITRFSLAFSSGSCDLEFTQNGETRLLKIATDGTRRLNELKSEGSPCSKVYLSGAWSGTDTFSVTARWAETCFEKRVDFRFIDGMVSITAEDTVGGFGPLGNESGCETIAMRA
jgi:CubicO group peptidase (beta-lactamase class C family)